MLEIAQWTGYNLSSLESGNPMTPGFVGIQYPASLNKDYAKVCYEKGIGSLRIPIMLERLIPNFFALPGEPVVDRVYSGIVKDFVKECEKYGINTFLDIHNYGAYNFVKNGGFFVSGFVPNGGAGNYNIFDDRYKINATAEMEIRDPTNLARLDPYEIVVAGNANNPLPNSAFKWEAEYRMFGTNGQIYEGMHLLFCYKGEDNKYWVEVSPNSTSIILSKRINGVTTVLGTATIPAYVPNSLHKISVSFNQAVANQIQVSYDNAVVITGAVDPLLVTGKVGFLAAQAQVNVKTYGFTSYNALGVADTTSLRDNSGNIFWGLSKGTTTYNVAAHEFFYTNIVNEFDSLSGLTGYMYNEPHDLAVPTTPANYLSTATATIFQQAALNKIRQLGSTKWFGWTSDNYGGAQNIASSTTSIARWGNNFNIPWNDPLNRTFLDFHYYPDKYATNTYGNSGTYGSIDGQTAIPYTNTEIDASLDPLLKSWKSINEARSTQKKDPVPMCISEMGIPESPTWFPVLDYILSKLTDYRVGYMYFGIGEFFGNTPTNIAADWTEITTVNGVQVKSLTKWQERHNVVDKYLNKVPSNLNPSRQTIETKTTNVSAFNATTGLLTTTVNGVSATVTVPPVASSNQKIDKIIPVNASGNYVITPATVVPDEVNADGRAIYKRGYNGNFSGPASITALQPDEAYLVHVTNHYRVTSVSAVPGSVRTRVDFLAGNLNPINPTSDSQDSEDIYTTNGIQINTDQSVSRYYYGELPLSYFQQEIQIHLPNSIRATYPAITVEEQKLEIIVYIIKKNVYVSTPQTMY